MSNSEDYEKCSREIADTTRRLLIALNTGGIAVAFGVAGSLAAHGVAPSWAIAPVSVFVAGLVVSAASLFMAKHKAIKRRDAVRDNQPEPDFKKWRHRNFSYEIVTLIIFVVAVFVALKQIQGVVVKPKASQNHVEVQKKETHNKTLNEKRRKGEKGT